MGTGFGTRGGSTPGGVLKKIFRPPLQAPPPGGENFFSVGCLFSRPGGDFAQKSQKMASPGGEKFFSVGCLFSRPGGDFAQKSQKMASPGGQNFFSPGCFAPRGAPPPVFFTPGVGQIFGLRGGCTPHSALRRTESQNSFFGFFAFLGPNISQINGNTH